MVYVSLRTDKPGTVNSFTVMTMKEHNIPGFEKLIHFYDGNIEHLDEIADFVADIAKKGRQAIVFPKWREKLRMEREAKKMTESQG